jgi:hypothetical protein
MGTGTEELTEEPGVRPLLDLGDVDLVRVRVGYGHLPDGPEHDVFLLELGGAGGAPGFDEGPVLEALQPVVGAGGAPARPFSLQVSRHHNSWRPGKSDLEVRVSLATGRNAPRLSADAVAEVADAFRAVRSLVGSAAAEPLPRDDAIARAFLLVGRFYPEVHSDVLSLSDEQHVAPHGAWSIGLRTRHLDRYVVELGFVDGDPACAHLRHERRSEVMDSVGTGD